MPDRRQFIAIEHAPLGRAASRNREAVGQDRTLGLFQRYPSKPHFELRKTVVISARMETAISAGPAAPIGSPAGPWMRASSLSVKPAAPSRSSRAACVFLIGRAHVYTPVTTAHVEILLLLKKK